MEDAIRLLQEMIRLKSVNPPGDEEPVARLIASVLERNGIRTEVKRLEAGRANLIARIAGRGEKKSLVFSGHMDTVPPGEVSWSIDPFGAVKRDGRIYGRGASDMKGGLAAMVLAMTEISRSGKRLKGDLVLAATAGEEVDCRGARAMVEDGLLENAGAMVIGEPSNGEIFIAHKGALWVEVICYGKTAHGSMPEQGINAIQYMNNFLNVLQKRFSFQYRADPLLGAPTLSPNVLVGGVKTNVVPDVCRLQIDIRTIPGQNHSEILDQLRSLTKEIEERTPATFEVKVLNDNPPVCTSSNEEIVQLALTTAEELFGRKFVPKGVRYYTDASVFVPGTEGNLPVIIYGPGDEKMAHQPDECIETKRYFEAIRFYKELALRWLT